MSNHIPLAPYSCGIQPAVFSGPLSARGVAPRFCGIGDLLVFKIRVVGEGDCEGFHRPLRCKKPLGSDSFTQRCSFPKGEEGSRLHPAASLERSIKRRKGGFPTSPPLLLGMRAHAHTFPATCWD
jgi:hypothetical protein